MLKKYLPYIAILLLSCTSKHIQKSVTKSDSTQVKKSAVITKADLMEISTSTDTGKEKEVIEETTVKEVDTAVLTGYLKLLQQLNRKIVKGGDTLTPPIDGQYFPTNGTAQDYFPTKTTTTKRTTRTVDHNKKDSTAKTASIATSDIKSDSVTVKKQSRQVERKIFRVNWWWLLLLLIPFLFKKVRVFFRLPLWVVGLPGI